MIWTDVRQRINERIEALRTQLESADGAEDFRRVQGEIAGLRWVLAIPDRANIDDKRNIEPRTSGYL